MYYIFRKSKLQIDIINKVFRLQTNTLNVQRNYIFYRSIRVLKIKKEILNTRIKYLILDIK